MNRLRALLAWLTRCPICGTERCQIAAHAAEWRRW